MAMTKKERAEFDAALERVRLLGALRWTMEVKPDVFPPRDNSLATGFMFNAYDMRIEPACSSSCFHSIGRSDKTTTQNPRSLYSTRTRALMAMRNKVELESAEKLKKIDSMLETLEQPPVSSGSDNGR